MFDNIVLICAIGLEPQECQPPTAVERVGLGDTSMSVGDVVVVDGKPFVAASFGFEPVEAGQ